MGRRGHKMPCEKEARGRDVPWRWRERSSAGRHDDDRTPTYALELLSEIAAHELVVVGRLRRLGRFRHDDVGIARRLVDGDERAAVTAARVRLPRAFAVRGATAGVVVVIVVVVVVVVIGKRLLRPELRGDTRFDPGRRDVGPQDRLCRAGGDDASDRGASLHSSR